MPGLEHQPLGRLAGTGQQDDLDFFIHLGDYIYETVGEAFQTGLVESRHTA